MKLSAALPFTFNLPELSAYSYGQVPDQYYIVPMQSQPRSPSRTLSQIDRAFQSSMGAFRSDLLDPFHFIDPFEMRTFSYRQPYVMRRNKNNLVDEIKESLDKFEININIPKGMNANDINLELMRNGEILRFRGSHKIEKDNIMRQSQISRMFTLGKNADTSKVIAKLSDGLLQVTVPKIVRDEEPVNIKIEITENAVAKSEKEETDEKHSNDKTAHKEESKQEKSKTESLPAMNNNEDDFEITEN